MQPRSQHPTVNSTLYRHGCLRCWQSRSSSASSAARLSKSPGSKCAARAAKTPRDKEVQPRAGSRKGLDDLFDKIMPESEGDMKDWIWMILSTLVLVYFSASLFMIYERLYYAAGFVTVAEYLSR